MAIGNNRTEGNKGNNFPWQHKVLVGLQQNQDALQAIIDGEPSKFARIAGSDDYNRALTYEATTGNLNVLTIVHSGTTANGSETLTETLTYVDETVNGSNVINIQYS